MSISTILATIERETRALSSALTAEYPGLKKPEINQILTCVGQVRSRLKRESIQHLTPAAVAEDLQACVRSARYFTPDAAGRAVAQGQHNGPGRPRVYACRCGSFHVTHDREDAA